VRRQTDAAQVRIAVRQRDDRPTARERFERGPCIGVQLDAIARGEEDVEGRVGECGVVAGERQRARQALAPHAREVVTPVRVLRRNRLAQGAQRRHIEAPRRRSRVLCEPRVQLMLGTLDGGPHRPKCVVEIERQRLDRTAGTSRHQRIQPLRRK